MKLEMENNLKEEKEFTPHWGVLVSYTNGRSYGMFSVDYGNKIDQNLQPVLTNEDVTEIMKYGRQTFQDNYFVILNMMIIWIVS